MHYLRVAGNQLAFSAGHFITLADGVCESPHGHDYRVCVELWGGLGPHHYLVDYVALEKLIQSLLGQWDHKVLLPASHPEIHVAEGPREVTVTFADRRWVLPRGDCRLLEVANTTTERLAEQLAMRLLAELERQFAFRPARLRVEISEGLGRSAGFELGQSE